MIGELLRIAGQCDGVRCDMAMLVLPDVFERTWGAARRRSFWPEAIAASPRARPGLPLHGRGLLGPGVDAAAAGLRLHLRQAALRPPARGPRAPGARAPLAPGSTTRTSSPASSRTTTSRAPPRPSRRACTRRRRSSRSCRPGLRFFHQGQFEGRTEAHLAAPGPRAGGARRRAAAASSTTRLLAVLRRAGRARRRLAAARVRAGLGRQLDRATASSPGRGSGGDGRRLLVAVNYAPTQGQCYVRLAGRRARGRDRPARGPDGRHEYERDGDELAARGLYLDMPAWGYHVFEIVTAPLEAPADRRRPASSRRARTAKRADPALA